MTASSSRSPNPGRPPIHLLIVGGSESVPGGVEAFCDRSSAALAERGVTGIVRISSDTAFLRPRTLPRLIGGLASLVREGVRRPGCVWLQYGNLPDLAYLVVAKMLFLRVIVTPHLGANWRSQTNPVLRALSGLLLNLADRIALISMTQADELNLGRHDPHSLIRNFLPREVLEAAPVGEGRASDTLELIHSGRLSEGKGTFLTVEMCARLRDMGVPFRMRITGGADAETCARLIAMIAEYRLEDRVEFLGRVPEQDLIDLLGRSDLLVHLSRIDSYPLIVLEAMACSALAVVMDLPGARDQVETYGGHVVSHDAPVEEAAAWIAAQDPDDLRRRGRDAARRVRADYAWPRCAAALDAALQACIAGDRERLTRPEPVA